MSGVSINYSPLLACPALAEKKKDWIVNKNRAQVFIIKNTETGWQLKATQAIEQFLKTNNSLCPTFDSSRVKTLIEENTYLVVYVATVSLAATHKLPLGAPSDFRDNFSLGLAHSPALCSQGHVFEKERLKAWVDLKGDFCPLGQHPVGEIIQDDDLAERIKSFTDNITTSEEERQALEDATNKAANETALLRTTMQAINNRVTDIESDRRSRVVCLAGGGLKIGVRGTLIYANGATIGKNALSKIGKYGKEVPVLSVGVGLVLFFLRFQNNQRGRAFAELASGFLGCFPGPGTFSAIGIDCLLAAADGYEEWCRNPTDVDRKGALEMLRFDADATPLKEEINKRFKQISKLYHPDNAKDDSTRVMYTNYQTVLNGARARLLKEVVEPQV